MNPLASRLEKQPPLIKEDEEDDPIKKRPFSNCMLFVLLAVFVFALACFAVYTAVAMGVSVEKSQAAPLKPEALSTEGPILSEPKNVIKLPDENNETDSVNALPDPFNQRFRIRIFFKGKGDSDDNKDKVEPEQNKTEVNPFNGVPRARITFGKLIIRNLEKPEEVSSSEEASARSEESIKEFLGMKPSEKSEAPVLPSVLFNLLKFPEDPIEHFLSILGNVRNKPLNVIRMEQHANNNEDVSNSEEKKSFEDQDVSGEKKADESTATKKQVTTPEEPKVPELQNVSEKESVEEKIPSGPFKELFGEPKSEPRTVPQREEEKESSEKPMKYQQQERSPIENHRERFNPIDDLFSTMDHIISNRDHRRREHDSERPITPPVYTRPSYIRFYKFNPQMVNADMYSPMHQGMSYGDRHQYYPDNMMRLPLSPVPVNDRGYSNENTRMYQAPSTRPPTAYTTKYTTTPSQHYTHAPREMTTYRGESMDTTVEKTRQTTESPLKYTTNKMNTNSPTGDQSSMMDRIDTENIDPFENFIKSRLKV